MNKSPDEPGQDGSKLEILNMDKSRIRADDYQFSFMMIVKGNRFLTFKTPF
jgi:hypothetical protein